MLFSRGCIMVFVAFFALSLSACHPKVFVPIHSPYELTTQQRSDIAHLKRMGAFVFHQGDELTIILPVDHLFQEAGLELKSSAMPLLHQLAYLVSDYRLLLSHPMIIVQGHSDQVFPRHLRGFFSKNYAGIVAAFLWKQGVPRQGMRVVGLGAKHPIANQHSPSGAAFNRRVVIQVREAVR